MGKPFDIKICQTIYFTCVSVAVAECAAFLLVGVEKQLNRWCELVPVGVAGTRKLPDPAPPARPTPPATGPAPAATFCAEHWHGQPCCSGCNGTLTPGRLSILAPVIGHANVAATGCDDDAPPSGADEGDSSKGACTHRRRRGDQRGFKPEPLNGE